MNVEEREASLEWEFGGEQEKEWEVLEIANFLML